MIKCQRKGFNKQATRFLKHRNHHRTTVIRNSFQEEVEPAMYFVRWAPNIQKRIEVRKPHINRAKDFFSG